VGSRSGERGVRAEEANECFGVVLGVGSDSDMFDEDVARSAVGQSVQPVVWTLMARSPKAVGRWNGV